MTDNLYNTSPTGRLRSEAADAVVSAAVREAERIGPAHATKLQAAQLSLEAAARIFESIDIPAVDVGVRAIRALHDYSVPPVYFDAHHKAEHAERLRRILRDLAACGKRAAAELNDMGAFGAPPGHDWFDVEIALRDIAESASATAYELDLDTFKREDAA